VAKFGIAAVMLGIAAYAVIHWPGFYEGSVPQKIVALVTSIGVAGATYFLVVVLLRSQEIGELRELILRRPKGTRNVHE
jgi:hypothetical protein